MEDHLEDSDLKAFRDKDNETQRTDVDRGENMNFESACTQLSNWVNQSNGNPIDIGAEDDLFSFQPLKKDFEKEIFDFEKKYNISLPEDYVFFLRNVGTARFFIGEYSAGMEVISPGDIEKFPDLVFENTGEYLFPELLLVVSIPKTGAFGGFWMPEKRNENYSIFHSEAPPEYWIEEADFISFQSWIISIVKEKGEYLGA